MQIDPPGNSYAFVAAMYLKQEATASAPAPDAGSRTSNDGDRPV